MTYHGTFFICDVSAAIDQAKNTDIESIDYPDHVKDNTKELAKLVKRLEQSEPGDKIRHIQQLSFLMNQSALKTKEKDPRKLQSLSLLTDIDGHIVRYWIPNYLEKNTERGENLWNKLTGGSDEYSLSIKGKEFEIECGEGLGGFLNQEEIKAFKEELDSLEINSEDIELEKYDPDKSSFVESRGLEKLHEMCAKAADRENTVLVYVGPH